MEIIIIVILLIILLVIWMISTQRKLTVMDENINNAMNQIGVQISSRFDVLMALLDFAKGYSTHEILILMETVKSRRCILTAKSTPNDVLGQERIIAEALDWVAVVAEQFPEFKENENYRKCVNAVDSYENMLRTSCLIYNDSVTKFNRAIRIIPTSLIAGVLGFRKRDYLDISI